MITRRQILSLPLLSGLTALLEKSPKILTDQRYGDLGAPLTVNELSTLEDGDRVLLRIKDEVESCDCIVTNFRMIFNSSDPIPYINFLLVNSNGIIFAVQNIVRNGIEGIDAVITDKNLRNRNRYVRYASIDIHRHPTVRKGFGT